LTYSKTIIINSNKVAGTSNHTDFPMLIDHTADYLKHTGSGGQVTSIDGYDILFTTESGSIQLDHEIESYNPSTGNLVAWVRIPTLYYNQNTIITMTWGDVSITTSQENSSGVWQDDFTAVWHLDETSGNHIDSTGNNNTGTPAVTTQGSATGKINGCDAFDGSDDEIDVASSSTLNALTTATIEAWVKTSDNTQDNQTIFSFYYSDTDRAYLFHDTTDNYGICCFNDINNEGVYRCITNFTPEDDTWYYVAWVLDGTNWTLRVRNNDVNEYITSAETSDIGDIDDGFSCSIGRRAGQDDRPWYGNIDEVCISSTARTNDWINTRFNSMNSPETFYTIVDDYQYYRTLTIDKTKVIGSSNFTDFPILFSHTADWLKTEGNGGLIKDSNGYDIVFMASDGLTRLDHEIDLYNGTTGKLEAWVRIPTLNYDDDTTIRIYYSNPNIDAFTANNAGVWDDDFVMVQHFSETSGDHIDSTKNNNDSSSIDVVTQGGTSVAKIGGADQFNGTSDEVTIPASDSLDAIVYTTVEMWVRTEDVTNTIQYMCDFYGGIQDLIAWRHSDSPDGFGIYADINSVENFYDTDHVATESEWYHVVLEVTGTYINMYINGTRYQYSDSSTLAGLSNWTTYIGNVNPSDQGGNYGWEGYIDEVRVSKSVRGQDWIQTSHNTQNSPSTFYTLGPGIGTASATSTTTTTTTTTVCTTTTTPPP
jgi:hypothetical protein